MRNVRKNATLHMAEKHQAVWQTDWQRAGGAAYMQDMHNADNYKCLTVSVHVLAVCMFVLVFDCMFGYLCVCCMRIHTWCRRASHHSWARRRRASSTRPMWPWRHCGPHMTAAMLNRFRNIFPVADHRTHQQSSLSVLRDWRMRKKW